MATGASAVLKKASAEVWKVFLNSEVRAIPSGG